MLPPTFPIFSFHVFIQPTHRSLINLWPPALAKTTTLPLWLSILQCKWGDEETDEYAYLEEILKIKQISKPRILNNPNQLVEPNKKHQSWVWGQIQQCLWGSRWKWQLLKEDKIIQNVFLTVPPHFQHQNEEKKQLGQQPKRSFLKVI